MPAPAVSVVMPVRDAAPTVEDAVASLLRGTFRDFELCAVDDGSTDDTRARLDRIAAQDSRVRVLHRPARGIVAALNDGLAAARGGLVARMDGDDLCHPERLEAQVALLRERPEIGVVGTLVEAHALGGGEVPGGMGRYVAWTNGLVTPEEIARERFVESPMVHPTMMARREVLAGAGGYREGVAEDYDLWLRLLGEGILFAKVPRALFFWRDHPARATRKDVRYAAENMRALKLQHLLKGPLAARPPVILWGAGLEGKPVLRGLCAAGIRVPYVVEADPRKIGNTIHGAAVIPDGALDDVRGREPGALVLVAVGVPSARPLIRAALVGRGLVEGMGFWFLC